MERLSLWSTMGLAVKADNPKVFRSGLSAGESSIQNLEDIT
jgi:hypothetical protein